MKKSTSGTRLNQVTSCNKMNRSSSTDSLKADKHKIIIKKSKSVGYLDKFKTNAFDVVKTNTPGIVYDVVKKTNEHMQSQSDEWLTSDHVHSIHNEMMSVVASHLVDGSVVSLVTRALGHHV